MDTADVAEQRPRTPEDVAAAATAPARWLLETANDGGVPLTQTHWLARVVVREAAGRWPGWWNAELFGVPHREADMVLVGELREGLLRKRLVRRRGSRLLATAKGRKLSADPIALLYELALDLGRGDLFTSMVADVVVDELSENASCTHDQLVAPAHAAAQWVGVIPTGTRRASGVSRGSSATSYAVARRVDSWSATQTPTSPRAGAH